MKVYIVESGCRYEGSNINLVTLSFIEAWKKAKSIIKDQERVLFYEREYNYGCCKKYIPENNEFNHRLYWMNPVDFVSITEYGV